jgi:hypothetical protein
MKRLARSVIELAGWLLMWTWAAQAWVFVLLPLFAVIAIVTANTALAGWTVGLAWIAVGIWIYFGGLDKPPRRNPADAAGGSRVTRWFGLVEMYICARCGEVEHNTRASTWAPLCDGCFAVPVETLAVGQVHLRYGHAGNTCGLCGGPLPDARTRWVCPSCQHPTRSPARTSVLVQ